MYGLGWPTGRGLELGVKAGGVPIPAPVMAGIGLFVFGLVIGKVCQANG